MTLSTKAWAALGRYIEIGKPFEWYEVRLDEQTQFQELASNKLVARTAPEWTAKINAGKQDEVNALKRSMLEAVQESRWSDLERMNHEASYLEGLIKQGNYYVVTAAGRQAYQEHMERVKARAAKKLETGAK